MEESNHTRDADDEETEDIEVQEVPPAAARAPPERQQTFSDYGSDDDDEEDEKESDESQVEGSDEADMDSGDEQQQGEQGEQDDNDQQQQQQQAAQGDADQGDEEEAPLGRMDLAGDEVEWARALQTAIEEAGEIPMPSDFELVQWACVEQHETETAYEKACALYHFREEYEIVDTVENGLAAIREMMRAFPAYFLSFFFLTEGDTGHYTLAMDITKLNAAALAHPDGVAMKIYLRAKYFCLQALNPDIEAFESGIVFLIDCAGFDWHENVTFRGFKQIHMDLMRHYPTKWHRARHYHTGLFFNMMKSMGKPFFSENLKHKIEMGYTSPSGRLDAIFLQPNVEVANEKFLEAFGDALALRYQNQANFVLPSVENVRAEEAEAG